MKTVKITTILALSICILGKAQEKEFTKEEVKTELSKGIKINKDAFKFGVSLGFNYLTKEIYDATLSPVDNSLKIEKTSPASFLLSTSIVINPVKGYYRKLDNNNIPVGDVYTKNWPLSFVATVNLAQFGASETNSFNKKIDGGIGLGYRLSNDFHIALTAEMISVRQLRSYVVDSFLNQPIVINGEELNALDTKDDKLFIDKYYFGFSLKFIYILID